MLLILTSQEFETQKGKNVNNLNSDIQLQTAPVDSAPKENQGEKFANNKPPSEGGGKSCNTKNEIAHLLK